MQASGLVAIRTVADYQFGSDVGQGLFPPDVEIRYSKRTGRARWIYHEGKLLATLRSSDGMMALTLEGALRVSRLLPRPRMRVIVSEEAEPFILKGGDVFSRHVVMCDKAIVPGQEVIVEGVSGELLGVGRALLCGVEMGWFVRGVAVKVRRGKRF